MPVGAIIHIHVSRYHILIGSVFTSIEDQGGIASSCNFKTPDRCLNHAKSRTPFVLKILTRVSSKTTGTCLLELLLSRK